MKNYLLKIIALVLFAFVLSCESDCQVPSIGGMQIQKEVVTSSEGDPNDISFASAGWSYGTTNIIPTYIADIIEDDIIFIAAVTNGSGIIYPTEGWTEIYQENHTNSSAAIFWRRADATTPYGPLLNDTLYTSNPGICGIFRLRGCKSTGVPFDNYEVNNITATNTPSIPEITTDGARYVLAIILEEDDNYSWLNLPSVYTRLYWAFSGNSTDFLSAIFSQIISNSGTIASESFSAGAYDYYFSIAIAMIAEP